MRQATTRPSDGGQVLWTPGDEMLQASNLAAYLRWLAERGTGPFAGYLDLWRWSVDELEAFWQTIWDFYGVAATAPASAVLVERTMPGAQWFPGARLNYAEHVLRAASEARPALVSLREDAEAEVVSWPELVRQVGALAQTLRRAGVGPGDVVVAYLPNGPAAVVGVLATSSIGAVWAACGPDFGAEAALQRFKQLDPKVLLAADGYRFGGRDFDRTAEVVKLATELPSVTTTIFVGWLDPEAPVPRGLTCPIRWSDATAGHHDPVFEDVAFDHPLWVLFSSGTTGRPKGIVQGHGGILLEHLKVQGLMNDVRAGDRVMFLSSTTWMVWNTLVSTLLLGATAVLFDGDPMSPDHDALWRVAEEQRLTLLGVSAGFVHASRKAGLMPGREHDLSSLRCLLATGSPLSHDGFRWVYESVGDVWLSLPSGGTDVCTSFVGGCCLTPVKLGRLQPPALGVAAAAFDDQGRAVYDQRGELVITEPMPSMPVRFWDDPDGARYRAAYFGMYPGAWRQGDFVEFSRDGFAVISGRSDSTLNRRGIRIGSAEIYSAVESLPEVAESLVIGVELPDGDYYMPLFVAPTPTHKLDDDLRAAITREIRRSLSPRHVPDEIVSVPAIPHTRTGKKLEVPVKRLYQGLALEDAVDLGSVDDPELLRAYAQRATRWLVDAP